MTRDPLTDRILQELREVNRDPMELFEKPDDRPLWQRRPWNRWDGLVALLLVLISSAISFGVGWLIWRLLIS
jgi:hypothetical protein